MRFAEIELRKLANVVSPTIVLSVTGDPDDNRILECGVEASSNFILTYDKGLLRLGEYAGIRIVRADRFLKQRLEL